MDDHSFLGALSLHSLYNNTFSQSPPYSIRQFSLFPCSSLQLSNDRAPGLGLAPPFLYPDPLPRDHFPFHGFKSYLWACDTLNSKLSSNYLLDISTRLSISNTKCNISKTELLIPLSQTCFSIVFPTPANDTTHHLLA